MPWKNMVPSRSQTVFGSLAFVSCLVPVLCLAHTEVIFGTAMCSVLSLATYFSTSQMVRVFALKLRAKGIVGKDLNKIAPKETGSVPIPEALGIVPASLFFVCVVTCQWTFSSDNEKLLEYNAALVSLVFMTLLGFVDDVLDLPWRYKMTLPFFASLPIIMAYSGGTTIKIPSWIVSLFNLDVSLLDLGRFYHLYMVLLVIFCCNSINIFAGVNGLEIGQSLVICAFIILYSISEILTGSSLAREHHHLSLMFSVPFTASSLGLLRHNWYPSTVFVGDSYTYFAGMYFGVVGILGHFSKMMILFFIPQFLNFVISLPQLFRFVPCPRHRVPRLNRETGKLESSGNFTLINAVILVTGPIHECTLVKVLLLIQVVCCGIGLIVGKLLHLG